MFGIYNQAVGLGLICRDDGKHLDVVVGHIGPIINGQAVKNGNVKPATVLILVTKVGMVQRKTLQLVKMAKHALSAANWKTLKMVEDLQIDQESKLHAN